MGFTNEAAFYFSFLPETYEKYIVMLKSHHPKRTESLAEYYYRKNRHLLGKTKVVEFDLEQNKLRIVGQNAVSKAGEYLLVITKHPNYHLTSDADPKNIFDIEKYFEETTEDEGEGVYELVDV